MLEVNNLALSVRDHVTGAEIPILHGSTFSVARGEALGLVGESGSGKSMTLKCILGAKVPHATISGEIMLDGVNILNQSPAALRTIRATELALIAQDPHGALNPVLPVGRFLIEGMTAARKEPRAQATAKAEQLLRDVGIPDPQRVMRSFPHQLSGGLLQRIVIAGALSGTPKLLLADEPTTALDVTTQAEVAAILDELRRQEQLAMIFVTHDLDLAAAVCDNLAVMKDGEIVEHGSAHQVQRNPRHEYTAQLMAARPLLFPEGGQHT